MRGNLLEAYCALAKAYCFLDVSRYDYSERKINELNEKIKAIQKEIYKLGGEK